MHLLFCLIRKLQKPFSSQDNKSCLSLQINRTFWKTYYNKTKRSISQLPINDLEQADRDQCPPTREEEEHRLILSIVRPSYLKTIMLHKTTTRSLKVNLNSSSRSKSLCLRTGRYRRQGGGCLREPTKRSLVVTWSSSNVRNIHFSRRPVPNCWCH